ncbi:MAG: LemA family protein [Pseudomonadales bacterium]
MLSEPLSMMRYACGFLTLLLLPSAIMLSQLGFGKVQDFRMLERIPVTSISAAIPGEVQLKGQAEAIDTVKAPRTGTPSIYYRYLVEREERDSEGNRRWRTITDETRSVDFRLTDPSGSAQVRFVFIGSTEVNVKRRHRSQSGNLRYTEWRLEQGDNVTLFGFMEASDNKVVNFRQPGHYLPIVSTMGGAAERSSLGNTALFLIWGSISTLIFACLCAMITLRIHRTLVFLSITCLSCFFLLANLGYQSVKAEVDAGYRQVESYVTRSSEQDADSATSVATLNERAATRHLLIERYQGQTANFPESWVKKTGNYRPFAKTPLTPEQQAIAANKAAQFTTTRASNADFLLIIGGLLAAALAWFAIKVIRVKRIQENIPTSKTSGVSYGLAEVKGQLKPEPDHEPFTGPVSGQPCCWYRELIQERRGSGKNAKWVTIKDQIYKQPFRVQDDEGEIRAFPSRADIITRHKASRREGNRRYSEWRLSPDDDLYVLGKAKLDKTRGDALVFGQEKGSPYIIANVSEAEVMLRKAMSGMAMLAAGMSVLFLAAIWLSGAGGSFSSIDFLRSSVIAPLFLLMVMFVLMYNDLVFLRERCERNWANIQVSLKKRADLLPRLESVVKEYLGHEQHLQQGLALLRERSRGIHSEGAMDQYMAAEHVSLAELQARIEQYPDLKASGLLQDFHKRLVTLENEVALIRTGYNDAVTQFRIRTLTFPDNLLAKLFNFSPRAMLSYRESAHPIPRVKLDF